MNGGAIIALFTLLGHFDQVKVQPTLLWIAFGVFAFGETLALGSVLLGYISQNMIMLLEHAQAESIYWNMTVGRPSKLNDTKRGTYLLRWAIVLAFLSLCAFTVGAGLSMAAVSLKAASPAPTTAPAASPAPPAAAAAKPVAIVAPIAKPEAAH